MGWPVHEEFLAVVREGSQFSRGWQFNSSLYVPFENFRFYGLVGAGASWSAQALTALISAVKLAVVAAFAVLMWRSRRGSWSMPARRHFEFVMAALFWLLVSQIVWEHYLAILFIPLAYFVATARMFPESARRMLLAIFVLCLAQNLVIMELVWTRLDPGSLPVFLIAGAVKAGPLLLALAFLWSYQASMFGMYRSREWNVSREERPLDSLEAASTARRVPTA
jgi:hypothetical protein